MTKAEGDHLGRGNHPGTTPSRSEVSSALSDLLLRVEGATEDSIDLFLAVAIAVDPVAYPSPPGWVMDDEAATWRFLKFEKWLGAGAYESAALALVERVLPGWTAVEIRSRRAKTAWVAELSKLSDEDDEPLEGFSDEIAVTGHAPTPALTLLAAMLKALIEDGSACTSLGYDAASGTSASSAEVDGGA